MEALAMLAFLSLKLRQLRKVNFADGGMPSSTGFYYFLIPTRGVIGQLQEKWVK